MLRKGARRSVLPIYFSKNASDPSPERNGIKAAEQKAAATPQPIPPPIRKCGQKMSYLKN
jgi:hypothetical protein